MDLELERARSRGGDARACELCGARGLPLEVHHLGGDRACNNWFDVVHVCRQCHRWLHVWFNLRWDTIQEVPVPLRVKWAAWYADKCGVRLSREMAEKFSAVIIELWRRRLRAVFIPFTGDDLAVLASLFDSERD